MIKRFTAIVSKKILSELGWSNPTTYAEVFDYLANNGLCVSISRYYDYFDGCYGDCYGWCVDFENTLRGSATGYADTWIEAANQAILACVELDNQ